MAVAVAEEEEGIASRIGIEILGGRNTGGKPREKLKTGAQL